MLQVQAVSLDLEADVRELPLQLVRVGVPVLRSLQRLLEQGVVELRRHVDQQDRPLVRQPLVQVGEQARPILDVVDRLLHENLVV